MAFSVKDIWRLRKTLIIFLTPILLLPLPCVYTTPAGRCAYGLLIMAVYWVTEAIPMAVTALLPVVLFPWLGVAPSKQLSSNYLKDTNMLFVGGLMVAVAVQRWNVHKRIALRVLLMVGSDPKWLMFGFMASTAFLSMWISNTATTAMMVPISQAVLTQLDKHRQKPHTQEGDLQDDGILIDDQSKAYPLADQKSQDEVDLNNSEDKIVSEQYGSNNSAHPVPKNSSNVDTLASDQQFQSLCKGLTLCICYAANIGGSATLVGTGTNVVLKGQVDSIFGSDAGLTFSSWFIFAFPHTLLCLAMAWIWLQFLYLGPRELFSFFFKKKKVATSDVAHNYIKSEYDKLGKISFSETGVLIHFVILAALWVTREPEFIPGWAYIFREGYVTDATAAITIAISLFMFPSRRPNYWCFRNKSDIEPAGPAPSLLDWATVQKNLPWGIILVLGGGFALADACKSSGLSEDISKLFISFHDIPGWIIVLGLCVITATFTEVTSNVATVSIFLPILAELARTIHINPLYLMIPTAVSASYAFMLPVATPPNAIVFTYGHLKIIDMVKAGLGMNLLCLITLQMSINTWGYAYFKFGDFPNWALNDFTSNITGTLAPISTGNTTLW